MVGSTNIHEPFPDEMSPDRWQVPEGIVPGRLDRYLAEHYGAPRNQVQRWIDQGRVLINDRPARASTKVAPGDWIACRPVGPKEDPRIVPEPAEIPLLHEDRELVVVNKPAGLTVHPGAGRSHGTLVNHLLARYPEIAGVGGPGRPGIVHRLDKGTTGVLVVARTPGAYQHLTRQFARRQVTKRYLALVYGEPGRPVGTIETPIARHPRRRKEMAVVAAGRPARTAFRRLAVARGVALLELDLATGRTHQIRVHLQSIGHPVVGDPIYGGARWRSLPRPLQAPLRDFPRPALHAWRLGIHHPETDQWKLFEAPVPADLQRLWRDVTGGPLPPLPAAPEEGGTAGSETRPPLDG